jgi:hypothetical protein
MPLRASFEFFDQRFGFERVKLKVQERVFLSEVANDFYGLG